ncbi:hypothetical protein BC832DRAFT_356525 [Gaertneriomyces semiglobifer]|nr:hypothetical protein BC832DRAFT_356525 [Gaertneriomyces semiglobifer]
MQRSTRLILIPTASTHSTPQHRLCFCLELQRGSPLPALQFEAQHVMRTPYHSDRRKSVKEPLGTAMKTIPHAQDFQSSARRSLTLFHISGVVQRPSAFSKLSREMRHMMETIFCWRNLLTNDDANALRHVCDRIVEHLKFHINKNGTQKLRWASVSSASTKNGLW